jgi:hypothetical protein
LNAPVVETTDLAAETSLARDMIAVHGMEAPTVARANARSAALAGEAARAKSWIRVLASIQRHQKSMKNRPPGGSTSFLPTPFPTRG